MATPRRRSPVSGFSPQGTDESLVLSVEEFEEDLNTLEEVLAEVEKQETHILPEIVPTDAPPPMPIKEAAQQEVVLTPEATVQQKIEPKRHPRNIPKFAKVRG